MLLQRTALYLLRFETVYETTPAYVAWQNTPQYYGMSMFGITYATFSGWPIHLLKQWAEKNKALQPCPKLSVDNVVGMGVYLHSGVKVTPQTGLWAPFIGGSINEVTYHPQIYFVEVGEVPRFVARWFDQYYYIL